MDILFHLFLDMVHDLFLQVLLYLVCLPFLLLLLLLLFYLLLLCNFLLSFLSLLLFRLQFLLVFPDHTFCSAYDYPFLWIHGHPMLSVRHLASDGYEQLLVFDMQNFTEWEIALYTSPDRSIRIISGNWIYSRRKPGFHVHDEFGRRIYRMKHTRLSRCHSSHSVTSASKSQATATLHL